ncbi:MAG: peptidase MA family metallohydrolase [Acidobacteriota bacterium]
MTTRGLSVSSLLTLLVLPLWLLSQGEAEEGGALLTRVHRLMQEGSYRQAEELLTQAADSRALRLRVELAQRRGDRAAARDFARRILSHYQQGRLRTSRDLAQAAFAAWQLDRWHEANDLFMEGAKQSPVSAVLYVDWGNLYLQKYNPAEAETIFRDALSAPEEMSPPARWGRADAYLGLARALDAQSKPGVEEALEEAAQLKPDNLDVISFHVVLALRDGAWKEGKRWLKKGLRINKRYLPLLELQTAYDYFTNKPKRFQKSQERVLAIDPADGDLFELLGDLCMPRRRLEEAIEFYRKAVALNPRQWSALASLGINLLRVGREVEGREILERAYANDPFNIWTLNTLRLLDSFDRFEGFETSHFRVRISKKEIRALRPYVSDLLETSLSTLTQRYNHPISGHYVFEMYPDHEDFAVRTLGLPGLGALGATFGRVVAMDSPSARPQGNFHWGSTLWHEMAHVVTLSLSRNRVPRWFTEGLSMMEERLAGPGWGDFLTPGFVKAYEDEKLLPLAELNSGFERPQFAGQVQLSYLQAGWVCDFLAARHGIDKIRAMLVAFGQGETMEKVFEKVLGASVEAVDKQFRQEMDRTLKPLVSRLKPPEKLEVGNEKLELKLLQSAVESHPQNYPLNLAVARKLMAAQREEEAVPYLQRAIQIFPFAAGRSSPYALLVEIYQKADEKEKWVEVLQEWWETAPHFGDVGLKLARLLASGGRTEKAIEVLEQVMFVDPLERKPHQMLGKLYLEVGAAAPAVREFRVLLALQPPDLAAAHYWLAESLELSGEAEAARQEVLRSLEIAPTFREAQRLLLRLAKR